MTKIAFISTMDGVPWGGSEELWGQTALRLAQRGFAVYASVMAWPNKPEPIQRMEQAGITVAYRQYGRLMDRVIRRVVKTSNSSWLDKIRPDFVIISNGGNYTLDPAVCACAAGNIPYVTIAQAAVDTLFPHDGIVRDAVPIFNQARANYFVSEANLDLTRRQFALPFTNGHIVRNPFSVRYEAAPAWPEPEGVYKLACVGRLDPGAKGQDVLFDVLRQDKWRERPLEVTLFGNGDCRHTLEALQQMYGLNRVHFGGYVNNVETIWETHHGLVLPSRYEGLPLSVVEAMLCGRICIVTDVSGNTELLEDNVTGFVAAAPATRYLDEAMERAWQQRAQWRQMGQVAAQRVRAKVPSDPIEAFIETLMPLITRTQDAQNQ